MGQWTSCTSHVLLLTHTWRNVLACAGIWVPMVPDLACRHGQLVAAGAPEVPKTFSSAPELHGPRPPANDLLHRHCIDNCMHACWCVQILLDVRQFCTHTALYAHTPLVQCTRR